MRKLSITLLSALLLNGVASANEVEIVNPTADLKETVSKMRELGGQDLHDLANDIEWELEKFQEVKDEVRGHKSKLAEVQEQLTQKKLDLTKTNEKKEELQKQIEELQQRLTDLRLEVENRQKAKDDEKRKVEEAERQKQEEAKRQEEAKAQEEAREEATPATTESETIVQNTTSTEVVDPFGTSGNQTSGSVVTHGDVQFGPDGLLVMEQSAQGQHVINLLLGIPGLSNGRWYHDQMNIAAEIDKLTTAQAIWVIYRIEGPGFGQTGAGHAGYDAPFNHQLFVEQQLNTRFGGSVHELLKNWGTYPWGGY